MSRHEAEAESLDVALQVEAMFYAVLAAKARLEAARLDIERSVIRAPIDGVVTRRQVQLGQFETIFSFSKSF